MSHSVSPNITSFFKPQRKRPRVEGLPGKLGKLEGDDDGSGAGTGGSNMCVPFLKIGPLSPPKKKKMTTEQVTRLLKNKKKLTDLKSALKGINDCAQQLDEFHRRHAVEATAKASPAKSEAAERIASEISSASKTFSPAPTDKFYSPSAADRVNADLARLSASKVSSPSKLINMNNKVKKRLFEEQASQKDGATTTGPSTVPAYQRFHNLAQKTPAEQGITVTEDADLPLPYKFKVLEELFIGTETVSGFMNGRKEAITFPKLKAGVLQMVRRVGLKETHLAQMVTVLPGCYTFDLEKVGQDTHIRLKVEELLPTVVRDRRKAFHANLIKICLEHHKEFLQGLVPPIVVPVDKQITRWHPHFKLDQVPDIEPQENILPNKPAPEKPTSAREVIARANHILENANPRMKQAVKNMLNKVDTLGVSHTSGVQTVPHKPTSAAVAKSLKGVSESLLEKIRNRERQKVLNELTRTPAESKKLQMMKKLPEFVKIIRNLMVAEKKVAMPLETVTDRVSHSLLTMTAGDTESHIRLLVKLLPNWIKIHKLSNSVQEYLKIDKATDINHVLEEMSDIIKKHSS